MKQKYEIILVDDNSSDHTKECAHEFARSELTVINRIYEKGLASAVVEGFKHARGDRIIVMDADLQHPTRIIPCMLETLRDSDIVIASRRDNRKFTISRYIISAGATWLTHLLFKKTRSIRDPMSGFFILRKSVIEGIEFNPIGFKILLEILMKGYYNRIIEFPYDIEMRKDGQSKLNIDEIKNFVRHLIRLRRSI